MIQKLRKFKYCALEMPVTTVGFLAGLAIVIEDLEFKAHPSIFSFTICTVLLSAIAFKGRSARKKILHLQRCCGRRRICPETAGELYYCAVLGGVGFLGLISYPVASTLSFGLKSIAITALASLAIFLLSHRKVRPVP